MALAAACGLIAANLYYAQPLIGLIGPSLGLPVEATGLVVTLIQIGYVFGLALVVPLGDLLENRRLICTILCLTAVALAAAPAWRPPRRSSWPLASPSECPPSSPRSWCPWRPTWHRMRTAAASSAMS